MQIPSSLFNFLQKKRIQRACVVLLSFCIVGVYLVIALNIDWLSPAKAVLKDFSMSDIYYQVQMSTTPPDTSRIVTIVDLTDVYDRSEIAAGIRTIERHNPKVLGIDAVFEGDRDDYNANLDLAESVSAHNNIICSYKLVTYEGGARGYDGSTSVHSFFREMTSTPIHEGFTNMPRELYGGMKRQMRLADVEDEKIVSSFAREICNAFIEDPNQVLPLDTNLVNINFTPHHFNQLKLSEVDSHPELIDNHIVLYGSLHEEYDMHITPIGKMSGVELLSYVIETRLNQAEIRPVGIWINIFISFILVFLVRTFEDFHTRLMSRSSYPFLQYFIGSNYITGLLSLLLVGMLMMGGFWIFSSTCHSFSFSLTLAATALLPAANSLFIALKKSIIPYIHIPTDYDKETTVASDLLPATDDFSTESYGTETYCDIH